MKFIAVSALCLPFALAYNGFFDGVDPVCAPCLNEVVADGPSNTRSKEFVNYLCVDQGAVQYYPEETCAAFEGTKFTQLPPCPEIRNGEGNGGNDSPGSDSEDSTTEAPAPETTEAPAPETTETTGSGKSNVTYSTPGFDSTGSGHQPTSSPGSGSSGSDSRGSGSSHTSAGGIPAAMGAFASWEMLTGLVILAVNI
ncbi:hypothetical protein FCULG_00012871 [Fusarium culmorum]|uniref:Uncharacterized protein n=1 Tax=Fusarium culmorum TaxID=5516 RepID=A0A2T4GFW5_FUSCU|nr:hypothetical protein FCULG_00012871 [Fusarium culmorum]